MKATKNLKTCQKVFSPPSLSKKIKYVVLCTFFFLIFYPFFSAVTDFTVTRARSKVMSFAQPITQIYHSLFIKNPSGALNYKAYIEPMHYLAWISVILFCLFTPPFLYMTARFVSNFVCYYF